MQTDKQLEAVAQEITEIYEEVQTEYIEIMGTHIKEIGKLTPTDVHRLTQIRTMNNNVDKIIKKLAEASDKAEEEIEKLFQQIAEEDYLFQKKYYELNSITQLSFAKNQAMLKILKAEVERTAGTLKNLSQTTASQLKKNPTAYREAVDKAVRSVTSGVEDYRSSVRRVVKNAAQEGITYIDFDTGYKRRLDSQVRMNVLEGARQTAINVSRETGKEFGADGIEISVHGTCAPDHISIQGKQYSIDDFDKLNNSLKRPIGTLNCRHYEHPIILGVKPTHSKEELQEINDSSSEVIEIDGVSKTRYEWTQEMRKTETNIRKNKDVANIFKADGDDIERRKTQYVINQNQAYYSKVSKSIGVRESKDRLAVAGFRPVKAIEK